MKAPEKISTIDFVHFCHPIRHFLHFHSCTILLNRVRLNRIRFIIYLCFLGGTHL